MEKRKPRPNDLTEIQVSDVKPLLIRCRTRFAWIRNFGYKPGGDGSIALAQRIRELDDMIDEME